MIIEPKVWQLDLAETLLKESDVDVMCNKLKLILTSLLSAYDDGLIQSATNYLNSLVEHLNYYAKHKKSFTQNEREWLCASYETAISPELNNLARTRLDQIDERNIHQQMKSFCEEINLLIDFIVGTQKFEANDKPQLKELSQAIFRTLQFLINHGIFTDDTSTEVANLDITKQ